MPEIHSDGVSKILNGPDMRLSIAMISEDFLKPGGEAFRAEAHLLHHEGLLSHVVTLASGGLLGKDMESYSLPMPGTASRRRSRPARTGLMVRLYWKSEAEGYLVPEKFSESGGPRRRELA